ncbi:hypothetical protein D5086_016245 [Populus alba]|uniref:Uncharacterized protein n=1 Tax=Populus alba TaxID=43335 RepID=A0ACC4BW88_POPAL
MYSRHIRFESKTGSNSIRFPRTPSGLVGPSSPGLATSLCTDWPSAKPSFQKQPIAQIEVGPTRFRLVAWCVPRHSRPTANTWQFQGP